jgi:hypothetical protein
MNESTDDREAYVFLSMIERLQRDGLHEREIEEAVREAAPRRGTGSARRARRPGRLERLALRR